MGNSLYLATALALFVLPSAAGAQISRPADYHRVKPGIRSIEETVSSSIEARGRWTAGKPHSRYRSQFDRRGRLVAYTWADKQGSGEVATSYDSRRVTQISGGSERVIEMDTAGREVRVVEYNPSGARIFEVQVARDSLGRVTQRTWYDSTGREEGRFRISYVSCVYEPCIEDHVQFARGLVDVACDSAARSIRVLDTSSSDFEWKEFRFDASGRMIAELTRSRDAFGKWQMMDTTYYAYDRSGNVIEERRTWSRSSTRFEYEFDRRGNWITKTALLEQDRFGRREWVPMDVYRRKITYW